MDFTRFDELFKLINEKMAKRERVVLAIDGGAASGKTTLAALISEKYAAAVVHMDDFFLPPARKTKARMSEPDGNIDRERFMAEVLPYINSRAPFSYGKYDCSAGKVTGRTEIPAAALVVVEGVYSLSDHFSSEYDIKIMLTVSEEEQLSRLKNRSTPEEFEKFKKVWLPLEKRYFALCSVREKCDMVF